MLHVRLFQEFEMTKTTLAVKAFLGTYDGEPLAYQDLGRAVETICGAEQFKRLLLALINSPAFSEEFGREFASVGAIKGLSALPQTSKLS